MDNKRIVIFLGLLIALLVSAQAEAIPAFARTKHMPCSSCHSAYPALNAFGRDFKTNGYRVTSVSSDTAETMESDFSKGVDKLPIAVSVISRPYISNDPGGAADKTTEIRAIHEAEIFVGGVFYQRLSGFIEYEAEGEDGFGALLGSTVLNYDAADAAHIQIAYAPSFFADPYDTLSDMRKMSSEHYNVTNDTFYDNGDNGGKIRHSRQQVSVFGRVIDNKLFYNVGIGGLTEDNVGNQSTVSFARVAFDILPNVMVGAFGMNGTCKTDMVSDFASCDGADSGTVATKDRDFSRTGFDFQADVKMFRLTGAYMTATDDVVNSNQSVSNNDYYLQAVYYGKIGDKAIVPLVRYQSSENNDGNDKTKRVIAGVSYYVQDNFKAVAELGKDTDVPSGSDKSTDITLELQAAF